MPRHRAPFVLEWKMQLDAPVVSAPVAHALLDLLAVEVVFESLLGEFDNLVVAREAKSDQLVLCQTIDLRMPLDGRQGLQTEALFQPNYSILHLHGVLPEPEEQDEAGEGKDGQPDGPEARMQYGKDNGCNKVDDQHGEKDDVKKRIEAGVILITLGSFRHVLRMPREGLE